MGCTGSKTRKSSPRLTDAQLKALQRSTKFSRDEIHEWHEAFIRDCPTGQFDRKALVHVFNEFYPGRDVVPFCKFMFAAIDQSNNGFVDFMTYMHYMNIFIKGETNERLEFAFEMCDTSRDGLIDVEELSSLMLAINMLDSESVLMNARESRIRAKEIIENYDLNGDQKITKAEFVSCCKTNPTVARTIVPNLSTSQES